MERIPSSCIELGIVKCADEKLLGILWTFLSLGYDDFLRVDIDRLVCHLLCLDNIL